MLKRFTHFIQTELKIDPADRVLLAVSGGRDSVCMSHLFSQTKQAFGIAHINFQLRGAAANADEQFVQVLAERMKVPFFSTRFDTKKISQRSKGSVQMVARELRYEWLHQLAKEEGYDWIATAHHLTDSIETVLYNLTRGSGLRGLTGIPAKNGRLIRPLLFASAQEVKDYVDQHQIDFREDASNQTDDYDRNKIRHHVLPVLRQLNPSLEDTFSKTTQHLIDTQSVFEKALKQYQKEWRKEESDQIIFKLKEIRQHPHSRIFLYESLRNFQFNADQIDDVLRETDTDTGRQFFSPSHQLLIDRDELILTKKNHEQQQTDILIEMGQQTVDLARGHRITLEWQPNPPTAFSSDPNQAWLDATQLSFPLRLRNWQAGDVFQPLGMQGQHQKVKDYLINQKINRLEKAQVKVLMSGPEICWLVGHRVDERFKIGPSTREVLHVCWHAAEKNA